MIVPQTAAYGIYPTEARVQEIIASLQDAGCSAEDVCLLLAPSHPMAQAVRDAKITSASWISDVAPASDLLQWFSRLGAVVIPGVAFFVGSGAFLRAVLAPCPASSSSASAERLMGLGLSENEAERYANRLSRDGIMIFASCNGDEQSRWIREVLQNTGADEACCLPETIPPACLDAVETAFQTSA